MTFLQNDQIMILDLENKAAVRLNFEQVQGLRDLAEQTLSLSGYCKSNLQVLKALNNLEDSSQHLYQGEWSLQPYRARLDGFVESISALSRRIGNAIDLVCQFQLADTPNSLLELPHSMRTL